MRSQSTCSIDGCERPFYGRQLCNMHYLRWLRANGPCPLPPVSERFWAKVQKTPACWVWTASTSRNGYGKFRLPEGPLTSAHRISWEWAYGPVPEGMCVLHRCDNPPCVRPEHLFLGTIADNNHDCVTKGRHSSSRKSHCPQGHPYAGSNLYIDPRGGWKCRECKRQRHALTRRAAARRVEVLVDNTSGSLVAGLRG